MRSKTLSARSGKAKRAEEETGCRTRRRRFDLRRLTPLALAAPTTDSSCRTSVAVLMPLALLLPGGTANAGLPSSSDTTVPVRQHISPRLGLL